MDSLSLNPADYSLVDSSKKIKEEDKSEYLIKSIFDLAVCNTDDKGLFSEKQKFLLGRIKELEAGKLSFFHGNFPIFKRAVREIKKNLNQWNRYSGSPQDLEKLKNRLDIQFKNLALLYKIVKGARTFSELQQPLMHYDLDDEALLNTYLRGDREIGQDKVVVTFKHFLDELAREKPEILKSGQLQKLREESPLTASSIKMQALLFKAAKLARTSAREQDQLQVFATTDAYRILQVSKASSEQTDFTTLLFKITKLPASRIMERLVWEIALINRDQDCFLPIKEMSLSITTQQAVELGLIEDPPPKSSRCLVKGTLQLSPSKVSSLARTFGKDIFNDIDQRIPMNRLIHAYMVSLVLGMYNADPNKILITSKQKIKFFHNVQVLPNSESFIYQGKTVRSSYWCALLALSKSFEKLSADDLKLIEAHLKKYIRNSPSVENFLRTRHTKSLLKKLPPCWLEVSSFELMEERIKNMSQALAQGRIHNLRDLVFAAIPGFKFTYLLHMIHLGKPIKKSDQIDFNKMQQAVFMRAKNISLNELTQACLSFHLDPAQLKEWCDDPSIPFDEILKRVLIKKGNPSNESLEDFPLEKLRSDSMADYKELESFREIAMSLFGDTEKNFGAEKFIVLEKPEGFDTGIFAPEKRLSIYDHVILVDRKGQVPTFTACFKDLKGKVQLRRIDYYTKPGMVKLEGMDQHITYEDLRKLMTPDFFYRGTQAEAEEVLKLNTDRPSWLVRPGTKANSLVISFVNQHKDFKVEHFEIDVVKGKYKFANHKPVSVEAMTKFMMDTYSCEPFSS